MKQQSLGPGTTAKRTRRRKFLEETERVVLWSDLVALMSPYLPEGRRGRSPFALETMLRIHIMQQ
jgi:transposase, IS5 family